MRRPGDRNGNGVCIHSIKQRPRPPLSTRRIELEIMTGTYSPQARGWPQRDKMVENLLEIGVRWYLLAVLLFFGAFSSAERE